MSTCQPTYPPGLPCDSVGPPPAPAPIPVESSPVPTNVDVGAQLVETGGFVSPWLVVLAVAVILIGLILWRVTK